MWVKDLAILPLLGLFLFCHKKQKPIDLNVDEGKGIALLIGTEDTLLPYYTISTSNLLNKNAPFRPVFQNKNNPWPRLRLQATAPPGPSLPKTHRVFDDRSVLDRPKNHPFSMCNLEAEMVSEPPLSI